ncbi:MAG: beta-lactamase family protein [Bacteroidota bacterium]|nr:beta-lactamase family protein [Bacteroidota bacterium]
MKTVFLIISLFIINTTFAQVKRVDRVVDSCIKKNFNGAVLIAKNGKIEYLKYTGIANRHYNIKYSNQTIFHLFSVTKTFTAALIMQLVEQNKVNLDSTISAYYPDYKGEAAKKVTIRNLLTYTSGMFHKDLSNREMLLEAYSNDAWPLDTFITRYLSEKLIDTPGTKFNYNNGDYILLGKIIENIYHKPYEQVLKEKILIPLKMTHTGLLHHEDIIKNIDEGYSNQDGSTTTLYSSTNFYIDNYYSAGGIYSTPTDLLKFDQAIFNHTIFKKKTADLMLTSYPKLGDVAFGFWVYPRKFGTVNTIFAERQGAGYGHNSNWIHLIDKGLTFIFLSNTNTVDLNKMRLRVIATYLGQ